MKNLYLIAFMLLFFSCTETSNELLQESDLMGKEKSLTTDLVFSPNIIVTTTSDMADFNDPQQVSNLPGNDRVISLREAIIAANNTFDQDVIGFDIPTSDPGFEDGVYTIKLESGLPTLIGGKTIIMGVPLTSDLNFVKPFIEIDCSLVNDWVAGIGIASGNNRIHGIIINRHSTHGQHISIDGLPESTHNYITGCYIGVAKDGVSVYPIADVCGISVSPGGASENYIGGNSPAERNIISGNMYGIGLANESGKTIIQGNYIGTDYTGNIELGNHYGIFIMGNNNIVGSSISGSGNLISGNGYGIMCHGNGWQLSGNIIEGNKIGTNFSGLNPLPNEWGITVRPDCENFLIKNNQISGNLRNGIHFCGYNSSIIDNNFGADINGNPGLGNGNYGVQICKEGSVDHGSIKIDNNKFISNNFGGVSLSGIGICSNNEIRENLNSGINVGYFPSGTHWQISKNKIYNNNGLGIDLTEDVNQGVTLNDPGDFDSGPNNLMNFPVLTSAKSTPGQLIVKGEIDTQNPKTVTVEFFANPVPLPGKDPTSYGEGAVYLGSVHPNPQGKFTATLPPVIIGTYITATATDYLGNTSEFSLNIESKPVGK